MLPPPCQRKKTLLPGGSPLPRVAPNQDGLGLWFCLGRLGGSGHVNPALPPTATSGVGPGGPAPPPPAEVLTRCLQAGRGQ